MSPTKSLTDNLRNRSILEFPLIRVIHIDNLSKYCIIAISDVNIPSNNESRDTVEHEKSNKFKQLQNKPGLQSQSTSASFLGSILRYPRLR